MSGAMLSTSRISNVDFIKLKEDQTPMTGAELQIIDSQYTNVLYTFDSADRAVTYALEPGNYYLHESKTPDRYKPAKDIKFKVDDNGRVYVYQMLELEDEEGNPYTEETPVLVQRIEMVNEPYKVIFHVNNVTLTSDWRYQEEYKSFKSTELDDDLLIKHFYDIPSFAGDKYVFAGWYYYKNEQNVNTSYKMISDDAELNTPVDFEHDPYDVPKSGEDYHIYAKWIEVGVVEKDGDDGNSYEDDSLRGFGLAGVQIRPEKGPDGETMYDPNDRDPGALGTEYNNAAKPTPAGLRFVTSVSEELLDKIKNNGMTPYASAEAKRFGVEYGYAVGTKANIEQFIAHYKPTDLSSYKLQYKGANVNGVDTTVAGSSAETDFRYIKNVNCTSKQKITSDCGIVRDDHRNYDAYRLYTLVVTYANSDSQTRTGDLIDARSYLRYYDANGKLRVFYNDYNDNAEYYGGCMCSFDIVKKLYDSVNPAEGTGD